MSRKPVIAANWKLNHTPSAAKAFVEEFLPLVAGNQTVEIVLCPSFTALDQTSRSLESATNVLLGGQNLYPASSGAFTGETSASMLQELHCTYVILGHSERRTIFMESNALINEKVRFSLENGLKVMFCVGETLEQREANETETVLETQIREGLANVPSNAMKDLVVAYEPVWAIGTGKTATPEMAQDAHAYIRGQIKALFGNDVAEATRIQYGGSVKPDNANTLMSQPDIDGALVGGAALKADSFAQIVNY